MRARMKGSLAGVMTSLAAPASRVFLHHGGVAMSALRLTLVMVVIAGCRPVQPLVIGLVPDAGAGECPCALGWVCCAGGQVCVRDASQCTVQVVDAGACSDECTVDARACDAAEPVSTLICQTGTDGCSHWVDAAACASAQACWLGECRCEGSDCIRLDAIGPPSPYFVGQVLVLTGRNFDFRRGAFRLTVNGTQINALLTSQNAPDADTRFEFTLNDGVHAAESGTTVRVQVENSTSADWRNIVVYPVPTVGGNIDVSLISSTPAIPVAGDSVELRFALHSRAASRTVSLSAVGNRSPWVPVLDSNRSPLSSVKLEAGAQLEVIVYVQRVPSERANVVLSVNDAELTESSGLVWLEPGLPTRVDSSQLRLSTPYIQSGRPMQLREAIIGARGGFDAPTEADAFSILTLWSFLAQPGTYQTELELIGGNGYRAGLHSSTLPTKVISAGAAVTESKFWLSRDPTVGTPSPGELVLRVRHVESGAVAEKRLAFTPAP